VDEDGQAGSRHSTAYVKRKKREEVKKKYTNILERKRNCFL
jgi:hypothetical protein